MPTPKEETIEKVKELIKECSSQVCTWLITRKQEVNGSCTTLLLGRGGRWTSFAQRKLGLDCSDGGGMVVDCGTRLDAVMSPMLSLSGHSGRFALANLTGPTEQNRIKQQAKTTWKWTLSCLWFWSSDDECVVTVNGKKSPYRRCVISGWGR